MHLHSSTIIVITLLLTGCATAGMSYDGNSLIPPPNLTTDEKVRAIHACNRIAHQGAETGVPLTDEQKALLNNRSTVYFFRSGTPVVNADTTPHRHKTVITPVGGRAASEVSDRYVLCFLERGYTWPADK
jgi:hypothetical protein